MTEVAVKLVVTVGDETHTFDRYDEDLNVPIRLHRNGETLAEFTIADLVGRTGPCFRCGEEVGSQVEVAYLDGSGRSDCPESEDGAPHEIDAPEGA